MRYLFLLTVIFFVSCASKTHLPKVLPGIAQVGRTFLVDEKRCRILRPKEVNLMRKFGNFSLVKPLNSCLEFSCNSTRIKRCLRRVPEVHPHLSLEGMDSLGVDVRILSIFSRVRLLVVKEGREVRWVNAGIGVVTLRGLELGRRYEVFGTIEFSKGLFGPLSPPLKFAYRDEVPPEPPPGGGVYFKEGRVVVIWEPSPSRDVVLYEVREVGGKGRVFEVRGTRFEERGEDVPKAYEVRAVDGAGNRSFPLLINTGFTGR